MWIVMLMSVHVLINVVTFVVSHPLRGGNKTTQVWSLLLHSINILVRFVCYKAQNHYDIKIKYTRAIPRIYKLLMHQRYPTICHKLFPKFHFDRLLLSPRKEKNLRQAASLFLHNDFSKKKSYTRTDLKILTCISKIKTNKAYKNQ